ncbi:hypothetical protein L7F22_013868 [Adiantum nelumboides]|nr:hypothetical protein [Adiantum nelumboides]
MVQSLVALKAVLARFRLLAGRIQLGAKVQGWHCAVLDSWCERNTEARAEFEMAKATTKLFQNRGCIVFMIRDEDFFVQSQHASDFKDFMKITTRSYCSKWPSWEYGLRKSFRQRLPIVPFDEKFLSSSQDTQCTVCLGDYQDGEKIQKLPACNHSFHVQCIDEWLTKNVTCPICRTSVLSEDGSVGFVDERPCEDGQSLDRTSGEEHRRWEERVVSEAQDQSHVIRIDNSDDITSDDVQASEITVGCWPAGEPAPNIERS